MKVVLGAALVALLFVPLASHGASGPPCTYLELERYEFDSVAKIKARHDCGGSPMLKVVISDGSMPDASGKKFLERQFAIDRVEEITFTPPAGQHRFLATLMFPDGSGDIDSAYFVTKKGAGQLVATDLKAPASANAGDDIQVSFKLADTFGEPLPNLPVVATIEYTRCDTYGSSLDYLTGWSKPGLAKASINIPRDMPPGDYDISVGYAGHRGYEMAPVSSKIRIDNPDEIPVSNLFYEVTDVNSSLFGSASNPIHGRGDIIKVTGKALSDGCIKPIAGLDVTGELQSSPGMSIASHAKTGRDGSFALTFQTYPQMESSDHSIRVRASYNNTGYETWVYNVRLRDLATFPFEVEGKRSAAQAMSNEAGKIVSVDLDAQLKKMTIVLDSKRNTQAQYEIAIPSELLSGDLVVTVLDGGEQAILTGDEYFADASGPVVDPVNDPRHIYSVSAFKRDGYAQVGFIDDVGGMRTIEIQGTTAIPEFGPMATLVLALFIAAATAIFGWRQANNLHYRPKIAEKHIARVLNQR